MNGQQITSDVAMQRVQQAVQESGIKPEVYVKLGKLAEQVLKNKNLYPQFVQEMSRAGVAEPNELDPKMDYQSLIAIVAMGRVSQKMGVA